MSLIVKHQVANRRHVDDDVRTLAENAAGRQRLRMLRPSVSSVGDDAILALHGSR